MIEVDLNDLVEFVIVDATRFPLPVPLTPKHPMHLHGHKFAVTAMYDVRRIGYFKDNFLLFLQINFILSFRKNLTAQTLIQ